MGEYIIVTGASFLNKGAQSMLFCVVNEMKNRFPGKKIVACFPKRTGIMDSANMEGIISFSILWDYLNILLYLSM